MTKRDRDDELYGEGDPFDDPLWKAAEKQAKKPPKKKFINLPMAWLAKVLPHASSAKQLAVILLLYRRMTVCRSKTFSFPNSDLEELGISRYTKYRMLAKLEQAGLIKTTGPEPGCAIQVKMLKGLCA